MPGAAQTERLNGLAPVWRPDAELLILGSFPGVASLQARQYYGHPRNQFWPLLSAIWGADLAALPYRARLATLRARGLGLWDVYASCRRTGSLDSAIAPASVEPNDLAGLFAACPAIGHVFFNGTAAETAFRRHVRGRIALPALQFARLPSTSPAHAACGPEAKLAAWQAVKAAADQHAATQSALAA